MAWGPEHLMDSCVVSGNLFNIYDFQFSGRRNRINTSKLTGLVVKIKWDNIGKKQGFFVSHQALHKL